MTRLDALNDIKKTLPKPKSFGDFKKTIKNISPAGWVSLFAYVELFDVLFVLALMLALFKDISDIVVSFIPYVGFILSLIISFTCTIFIYLILMLLGSGGIKAAAKRSIIFIAGVAMEAIPIISFFPTETAVTAMAILMILKGRKEKAEEQKEKKAQAQKQIEMQQTYVQPQTT